MIEAGWACLLCLAMLDRSTRPLALLLGVKWALNYYAVSLGCWTVPPYIDIAAGTVGVVWAQDISRRQGAIIAACFVVAPLVHAWHWMLWAEGVYVGVQYWAVMLGLFSAQTCALAWPGGRNLVLAAGRLYRFSRRRPLAGRAAPTGPRESSAATSD